MNKYMIFGAGMQGCAIAYDLLQQEDTTKVMLLDHDQFQLEHAVELISNTNLVTKIVDLEDTNGVNDLIKQFSPDSIVSAVPYMFNGKLTTLATLNNAHFCDLGGNTKVVKTQMTMGAAARDSNVSIIPDCGLAPGISNLLAAYAISKFDTCESVRVYCGGLPQEPVPPYNYKLVFSLNGLINEYSGTTEIIRDGKIVEVDSLSELEDRGSFEAAITTGGTSLAPHSFLGKTKEFVYKTLRYKGHFEKFKIFKELGLFESGKPRDMLCELLSQHIDVPEVPDMVFLSVEADGIKDGEQVRFMLNLTDGVKAGDKFSSMERCTGFPTAVIARMQANGEVEAGAHTIENIIDAETMIKELKNRGLDITEFLFDSTQRFSRAGGTGDA